MDWTSFALGALLGLVFVISLVVQAIHHKLGDILKELRKNSQKIK